MQPKTVRDILKEWLKAHGYDGLYSDDCGCENSDLMPCSEYSGSCSPGYKADAPADIISYHGDVPWVMMAAKPEKTSQ